MSAPPGVSPSGYAAAPGYPQPVPVDQYGRPLPPQQAQPYPYPPAQYGQPQPYASPQPYPQPGTYQATPEAVAVQISPEHSKAPSHSEPGYSHYSDVNNRPTGAGYASFMDKHIRHGFIRKVYSILTVQLLITFGITCIFVFSSSVKAAVQKSPGIYYAALGLNFAFMIAMACCRKTTQVTPWNYILLFAFTLTESYLVGCISSFYDTNTVLIALGITMGVTVALTIFACQTKWDFTPMLGILVGICWSLILLGILMIWFRSQALMTFYAWIAAALFSCFIVVDTQMIIGGNHKLQFSPDDYISAALNLYIDVIGLFLQILRIMGKK